METPFNPFTFILRTVLVINRESNSLKGLSFTSGIKLKTVSWILLIKLIDELEKKTSKKKSSNWIDAWWNFEKNILLKRVKDIGHSCQGIWWW